MPSDGWTHLLSLLLRVWDLLLSKFGTTTFAVVVSLMVFVVVSLVPVLTRLRSGLRNALTQSLKPTPTIISVAVTLGVWVVLFGWALVATIYKDHSDLVTANTRMAQDNAALRADKQALQSDNERMKKGSPHMSPKELPASEEVTSRHLTKIQVLRLTRLFSELPVTGPKIIVKTIGVLPGLAWVHV